MTGTRESAATRFAPAAGMGAAVLMVYRPPDVGPAQVQLALDHWQLHAPRARLAREALFGVEHALPAWSPRDLGGAPFWSNVQSFPFLPTRVALVLSLDPDGRWFYPVSIALAAVLSAAFTYAFARRIGQGRIAAAASGFTFAASGFFSSRVAAGHLPLLEVYAALPALLWAIEALAQARGDRDALRRRLAVICSLTTCVLLGGHPQLPVLALLCAVAYVAVRLRDRVGVSALAAMACGAVISAFSTWPMFRLVARSTRLMNLEQASNDIEMPYRRLLGFFAPLEDGMPHPLPGAQELPFDGWPNAAYFWDTICYVGIAPWLAVCALGVLILNGKLASGPRSLFLLGVGIAGIAFALPLWRELSAGFHGTFLRSSARFIYYTGLPLSLALGAAIDRSFGVARGAGVAVILVLHALDIGSFARMFMISVPALPELTSAQRAQLITEVGDGRVAMDYTLSISDNRMLDDVGIFDSVLLARPYRTLLDLSRASPTTNEQALSGAWLPSRALAAFGVRRLVTMKERPDLRIVDPGWPYFFYEVPHPAERAAFYAEEDARVVSEAELRAILRDPRVDPHAALILTDAVAAARPAGAASGGDDVEASVRCRRSSTDDLDCQVSSPKSGYLRLLETFDEGWSATVDGRAAPVHAALGTFLAVPVPDGTHVVHLSFRTPGAREGFVMSLAGLVMLGMLLRRVRAT